MSSNTNPKIDDPTGLIDLFPEARLTMRDRLPTPLLLFYTFTNINNALKNIKISAEEIGEAILGLVAMIPDGLRDEQFIKDLQESTQQVTIDIRPEFCNIKASLEHCKRKGIPAFIKETKLNYFEMYHAVFNLLMRKHMLLKMNPKEIMRGIPFQKEPDENEK